MRLVLLILFGVGSLGCSTPIERPTALIATTDPVTAVDAGTAPDAGPPPDAGPLPDGGIDAGPSAPDAGPPATGESCGTPVESPIAGRVGVAPPITGACSYGASRLLYRWRLVAAPTGSHARIADPSLVAPTIVPDVPGLYRLELVVSNGTLTSPPKTVEIEVAECGASLPELTATATPASPRIGETVQLDASLGSAATGCDLGELDLAFAWTLVSRPAASTAALTDSSARNPSFVPDAAGIYVARVVATSASGLTSPPVEVEIEVADCGGAPPVVTASAMLAGGTGPVVQLLAVTTDADTAAGCAAHAPVFEHAWSFLELPAGSTARLNDTGARNPSFTADVAGRYVVRVVVTDPTGRSSALVEASIDVALCGGAAPSTTASATPAAPRIAQPVQLDAATTDPDTAGGCAAHGPFFTHRWMFLELPAGSRAVLNDPAARNPSFVPDVAGRYVARVVVTDPTGRTSAPADATVTASSCGGAAPTIASIAVEPTTAPAVGQGVRLSPTFDDADVACGGHAAAFTFDWRFDELPRGSRAVLNDERAIRPGFVPDVSGTYRLAVTVTDPTGRTATSTRDVVVGTCGTNAPRATISGTAAVNAGAGARARVAVTDADTAAPCSLVDPATVRWRLAEIPAGSSATLSDPTADAPSFVADLPGAYVLSVVATDAAGHASPPATFTVTASMCGANVPVASAQKVLPGPAVTCGTTPITLTGSLPGTMVQLDAAMSSDADNAAACGLRQSIFFDWTLLVAPAGSVASLSSSEARNPWLVLDRSGEYRARLFVSDSTGLVSRETTCIVVLP